MGAPEQAKTEQNRGLGACFVVPWLAGAPHGIPGTPGIQGIKGIAGNTGIATAAGKENDAQAPWALLSQELFYVIPALLVRLGLS